MVVAQGHQICPRLPAATGSQQKDKESFFPRAWRGRCGPTNTLVLTFGLQSHKRRHSAVLSHRLLFGSPQKLIYPISAMGGLYHQEVKLSLVLVSPQVPTLAVPQSRSAPLKVSSSIVNGEE